MKNFLFSKRFSFCRVWNGLNSTQICDFFSAFKNFIEFFKVKIFHYTSFFVVCFFLFSPLPLFSSHFRKYGGRGRKRIFTNVRGKKERRKTQTLINKTQKILIKNINVLVQKIKIFEKIICKKIEKNLKIGLL